MMSQLAIHPYQKLDPLQEYGKIIRLSPAPSFSPSSLQKIASLFATTLQYGSLLGIGTSIFGFSNEAKCLLIAAGMGALFSHHFLPHDKENNTATGKAVQWFSLALFSMVPVFIGSFLGEATLLESKINRANETAQLAKKAFTNALEAKAKAFTLHSFQWQREESEEAIKALAFAHESSTLSKEIAPYAFGNFIKYISLPLVSSRLLSLGASLSCAAFQNVYFADFGRRLEQIGLVKQWRDHAISLFCASISATLLSSGIYLASRAEYIGLFATAMTYYFSPKNYRPLLTPLVSILSSTTELYLKTSAPTITTLMTTLLGSLLALYGSSKAPTEALESQKLLEGKATKAFCRTIVSQFPREAEKDAAYHQEFLFYHMIDEVIKSSTELNKNNLPAPLTFQARGCNVLQELLDLRKEFHSLQQEEQENFRVTKEESQISPATKNLWTKARNLAVFLYGNLEVRMQGGALLREYLTFAPKSSLS